MADSPDITEILHAWSNGDQGALDDLMSLVYTELKVLSRRKMAGERASHTLQPTALVNEVYLRLARLHQMSWDNRQAFFGFTGRLMRRVLVEHARALRAAKRGGEAKRVDIDLTHLPEHKAGKAIDILDINDILEELEAHDKQLVRLIELRFFVGLTEQEIAKVLGISRSTVQRQWRVAKRLLFQLLEGGTINEEAS